MHHDNAAHDLAMMDPELREFLTPIKAQLAAIGITGFNQDTVSLIRQLLSGGDVLPEGAPSVEERFIPGSKDAPDVRVFVVNAKPGTARPAILHMHGGGYVIGSAVSALPRLQQIARDNDCAIVSVEYRLAPETPFPGALDDNYAALLWLHANAEALGVDRAHINVMGESAGGGHAAMLAIAARDRGDIPIKHQFLIYPMLDDRTGSARQTRSWVGRHIWTAQDNRFGWSSLLGMPAGAPSAPARFMVSMAWHPTPLSRNVLPRWSMQ